MNQRNREAKLMESIKQEYLLYFFNLIELYDTYIKTASASGDSQC